ncbi:hypothetical protein NC652_028922 [Populus alba x Populus x berolinensis]|nr:hypothetical protein NC652_028922 [Populus alba x Populus x berolinensis]
MGFAVASMVVFVQIFPLDELVAMEVEGFDSGFSFTALFGSATTLVNWGLESGFEVIVSLSFKPRILLPLSGGSVTNETISDPRASAAGGVVDKCKGFDLADNLQLSIQEFRTNPSSLVLSLSVLETILGNILPTFVARRYSFYKNYR